MSEQIPFVKPVRVGGFKLWRSKYVLKGGDGKTSVDCLHVSDLTGAWMVRIPSTQSLYGTICQGYATTDDELREKFVGMILTNIYNISTCSSESLHDALFFLSEVLTFPYLLLSEGDMKSRMNAAMKALGMEKKERKERLSRFMEYRRSLYSLVERKRDRLIEEYERQQAMQRDAPDDGSADAAADEAVAILSE